MSAIPNLNTFRRARGGTRLRGGRGASSTTEVTDAAPSPDQIVQQTDNDASSSRLSAVELGYLQDDFAKAFARTDAPPRRYPLINRGTYVRTTALDKLVCRFLRGEVTRRKQIISLGAGSDTRFFRLCNADVLYHEIDFETNIAAKRIAIERSPMLKARQQALEAAGCTYLLHSIDLRGLQTGSTSQLDRLDTELPTLIISECCLCYLSPTEATATIGHFTELLRGSVALILYEPIRPSDAFGKTMIVNLASRGIHMQTVKRYASLEAQRQRLKLAGFSAQGARDVFEIWQSDDWTTAQERERIEKLEWLDEIEEWQLLARHYCIAWGCRGDDIEAGWADIDGSAAPGEVDEHV